MSLGFLNQTKWDVKENVFLINIILTLINKMPKDEQSFCHLGGLVINVKVPNCSTCFSQEILTKTRFISLVSSPEEL